MSDILIKNMEMPKGFKRIIIYPNGRVSEINFYNEAVMPTEAQVIEVPPHGRLIDADAFKDYLVENLLKFITHPNYAEAKQITEDFCKDIDEQPTILEASE